MYVMRYEIQQLSVPKTCFEITDLPSECTCESKNLAFFRLLSCWILCHITGIFLH